LAAARCTTLLDRGGPGWLDVLVLLFIWDAFRPALAGPAILVTRARRQDATTAFAPEGPLDGG